MIGHLVDLTLSRNGRQRVTVELSGDFAEAFDGMKDKLVNVEIKPYRERRSLDANAYAWVLIDKLAEALHKGKTEVYRDIIRDVGGVSETVCITEAAAPKLRELWESRGTGWQTESTESKLKKCVNLTLYYGSSVYDTAQMSRFIDLLVQECQQLGIPTDPQEAAKVKEAWGRR